MHDAVAAPERRTIADGLARDLVRAATLAPSPDNNQPWRFRCDGERIEVLEDESRRLPSDVHRMFSRIALGAAIENICVAARARGYEPRVTPRDGAVASVEFADGATGDPLFPYLRSRATNRGPYAMSRIPERELQAVASEASVFPGCCVTWVRDRLRILRLAWLVAQTDRIRFEHRPFHEELHRQLRTTVEEAERTRDGLDVRTLGAPPGTAALLRLLRPWERARALNRLGLSRLLSLPTVVTVARSGALGAITVPRPDADVLLEGGRAFQRLWLAAESRGLSLQPLGSLPIFLAQLEHDGAAGLPEAHRRKLRSIRRTCRALGLAGDGRHLLILFRLGYGREPTVRSARRSVADVLVPA